VESKVNYFQSSSPALLSNYPLSVSIFELLKINGIFNNVLKDIVNKGLKAQESNNKDLLNNVQINLEKACLKYERDYTNYLLENNDPINILVNLINRLLEIG
jgi:hypothetical protein